MDPRDHRLFDLIARARKVAATPARELYDEPNPHASKAGALAALVDMLADALERELDWEGRAA